MNLLRLASISPFVRTFLHCIRAVGLPIALAQAFDDCNIRLVVQGETMGWNASGKAVLLIGRERFLLAAESPRALRVAGPAAG